VVGQNERRRPERRKRLYLQRARRRRAVQIGGEGDASRVVNASAYHDRRGTGRARAEHVSALERTLGVSESLPFTGRVAPRSGVGWGNRRPLRRQEPHPAAFGRRPPRKGEVAGANNETSPFTRSPCRAYGPGRRFSRNPPRVPPARLLAARPYGYRRGVRSQE
jgi:hypothetical protein